MDDLITGYSILREAPTPGGFVLKVIKIRTRAAISTLDQDELMHVMHSILSTWMGRSGSSVRSITFDASLGIVVTLIETA